MSSINEIKEMRSDILDVALKLYGIDLKGYTPEFLERRIELVAARKGLRSAFQIKHELINNAAFAKELEMNISVNTTSMFRDPQFFKKLIPEIKESFSLSEELKIWHVGCSKGLEVFSLAILLKENGLLGSTTLYGTDISNEIINEAREGIIKEESLKEFSVNYRNAGGKFSLKDYFTLQYDKAKVNSDILNHTSFNCHRLGNDPVKQKFPLIICRNLFIYYNSDHQTKLLNSLIESLEDNGIICFGIAEQINQLQGSERLLRIDTENKIFRKKH